VRLRASSFELALELRLLVSGLLETPDDRLVWESRARLLERLTKGAELWRSPNPGRIGVEALESTATERDFLDLLESIMKTGSLDYTPSMLQCEERCRSITH
jgi:hypothetical protein